MKRALPALSLLLLVSYPIIVLLGIKLVGVRLLVLGVGGAIVFRTLWSMRSPELRTQKAVVVVIILGLVGVEFALNTGLTLMLGPAVINGALFVVFGYSLFFPPAVAERFARRFHPEVTPEQSSYCRMVTGIWCGVFLLNGSVAGITAIGGDSQIWAFYNGICSWVLVFAVMLGEMTYRYWRFRVYSGAPGDRLFRRIFPPLQF